MSKMETIRKEMVSAMKSGDKARKDTLSLLLSALKAKGIDKRADLTTEEEDAIILKELKQAKETLESIPASNTEMIAETQLRIQVIAEFAPVQMGEDEIKKIIAQILTDLNIQTPQQKDKGLIMKHLMPLVKGKADGALVSKLVADSMQ